MAFRVISKNYLNILIAQQVLHFLRLAPTASVLSNELGLYMKDLKLLVLAMSALKVVASYFE